MQTKVPKSYRKGPDRLTDQQRLYVEARASGLSATQAARECGYARKTAYCLETKGPIRLAIAKAGLCGSRDDQGRISGEWLTTRLLQAAVHRVSESQSRALSCLSRLFLQQVKDARANNERSDSFDLLGRMQRAVEERKSSESTTPGIRGKVATGGGEPPEYPDRSGNFPNARTPGPDPSIKISNANATSGSNLTENCEIHGPFAKRRIRYFAGHKECWTEAKICPGCEEAARDDWRWLSHLAPAGR